jgi:hypothetical protein
VQGWSNVVNEAACCKHVLEEECAGDVTWVKKCGTPKYEKDWTEWYWSAEVEEKAGAWRSSALGKETTTFACAETPPAFAEPTPEEADYSSVMIAALTDKIVDTSVMPVVLAALIIVLGPVMAVYNIVRPQPLTSYGRGFENAVHTNARVVLGLTAVALLFTVIIGWNGYGENGSAIELMMIEVSGLTAFIGMQLGEASGSLNLGLKVINQINTNYSSFPEDEGGFYRCVPNQPLGAACERFRGRWSSPLPSQKDAPSRGRARFRLRRTRL